MLKGIYFRIIVLAACTSFAMKAAAQDYPTQPPFTPPAPDYEVLTDNQKLVYSGVFTQCRQLVGVSESLSDTASRLLTRCGEIVVQNSGAISNFSDALQRTQAEEIEILGAKATEAAGSRLDNVSNRMQALRAGVIGMSLGVAGWEQQGLPVGGMASGDDFSRLGMFATLDYASGDREGTARSDGFDFDTFGATLGVDYRFSDSLIGGIAYQFSDADADVEKNYGDLESRGNNLTAYVTHFGDNYYVEGTLGAGRYDYDTTRVLDYHQNQAFHEVLTASPEGDQVSWSLGGGLLRQNESLSQSYYVQAQGVQLDIDQYTEGTDNSVNGSMALTVQDQDIESLSVELGAQFSLAFSRESGVLLPYLDVAWVNEFEDGDQPVVTSFANAQGTAAAVNNIGWETDDFDSSYFRLSAGTSFQMQNGLVLFFNYDTFLGLSRYDYHGVSAGLRKEL
ncbi:MAG: autotransporter outer membrane beta-barrel domain-containing protein [Luminiphilus sp.]|jgi:uncharacterized protein YhjY with autotransporter beta-barrel domain|nr:autotransporter outer membrane beta-barrel domain-containing protein [Luminiphilus sp.]MDG1461265.1 autotransporter outer membrane beta-barrel domain-containing protein [Luminiphilus sp.]